MPPRPEQPIDQNVPDAPDTKSEFYRSALDSAEAWYGKQLAGETPPVELLRKQIAALQKELALREERLSALRDGVNAITMKRDQFEATGKMDQEWMNTEYKRKFAIDIVDRGIDIQRQAPVVKALLLSARLDQDCLQMLDYIYRAHFVEKIDEAFKNTPDNEIEVLLRLAVQKLYLRAIRSRKITPGEDIDSDLLPRLEKIWTEVSDRLASEVSAVRPIDALRESDQGLIHGLFETGTGGERVFETPDVFLLNVQVGNRICFDGLTREDRSERFFFRVIDKQGRKITLEKQTTIDTASSPEQKESHLYTYECPEKPLQINGAYPVILKPLETSKTGISPERPTGTLASNTRISAYRVKKFVILPDPSKDTD